jgi:hypothetical protein
MKHQMDSSKLSREQMISSIAAWGVSFARHLAEEEFQTSGHGDNTTTTKRSSQREKRPATLSGLY